MAVPADSAAAIAAAVAPADSAAADTVVVDTAAANGAGAGEWSLTLIFTILFVAALIATLAALAWYLHRLRRNFYEACREAGNLELYASCPFGIPVGSVRSTLALLIVLFAIGYMVVVQPGDPPQFLTAVVSTVIGFYFGSRSSGGQSKNRNEVRDYMSGASAASSPAPPEPGSGGSASQAGRGEGPSPSPATPTTAETTEKAPPEEASPDPGRREEAKGLLDRLREGLSITEVASGVLPEAYRKQFTALTQTLQDGIDRVQTLTESGSIGEALQKGSALLDRFWADNPVSRVVERAQGTFGAVLGAVQPLPLIGTIATVTETLKEEVYDRWKKRILHTTFEPADLPIERVDANTGFTLLTSTPIMKEAFREELEANDRPFMENTAEELLATDDLESLWANYKDRFESRREFEEGVAEMRRTAADLELKEELDPALFEDTGGYEQTVAAIDELHTDEGAQGDLDAIVSMFEALTNSDGVTTSVRTLFEKIKTHLGTSGSGASA